MQVLFNLLTNALMNSNIIFDKLELEKGKQLTHDHTVTELRRERRFVWSLKCLSFVLWLHVAFRDKTELVKSIRKQPETHCLWALRGNIKIPEEGRITCQHLPPHYHISLSPKSLPNTKSHPPSGLRRHWNALRKSGRWREFGSLTYCISRSDSLYKDMNGVLFPRAVKGMGKRGNNPVLNNANELSNWKIVGMSQSFIHFPWQSTNT